MRNATFFRSSPAQLIAVTLIGCLLGCSTSRPPTFPEDATLDQKIEITREHLALPGAVVSVRIGDEQLIDQAFGVAALDTNEPMTTAHSFRVASITKPVIATIILQLTEEGRIGLDDAVADYLEEVPNGEAITLRMLAQHTSGLRNYIAIADVKQAFASEPTRSWTEQELLTMAYDVGPYFSPPGKGWMYSNTNYVLLGLVIERVEQAPLDDVIQRRICEPLGLTSTFYSPEPSMPKPFASGYQYGDADGPKYWVGRGDVPWDVTDASPSMWHAAGAMVSTLGDVARLLEAITTGELLSEQSFAAQTDWRDSGYPVEYDYGLGLIRYKGAIGHNGNVPGYQVSAFRLPDEDVSVVVLTNLYSSPNYEDPANAIVFVILRHITGRSYAPPGWEGW